MKVQINATSDTIVLKFVRPNPDMKLEGYILGYGSSMFSKQFIKLPDNGEPYETEIDAEPKYLVAVQPIPTNDVKKQCKERYHLEKPIHLVIGSVTPTSVLLSWGALVKTSYEGTILKDCLEDGNFTVRYRELSRKWNYQMCPTSDTVIDHLKPNTPYEFSVRPNVNERKAWSKSVFHNTNTDDKPKQKPIIPKAINFKLGRPGPHKPQLPPTTIRNSTRTKGLPYQKKFAPAPRSSPGKIKTKTTTTSLPHVPHSVAVTVPTEKSTSGRVSSPSTSHGMKPYSSPSLSESSHTTTQDADGEHHKGVKHPKLVTWPTTPMGSSSELPSLPIRMNIKIGGEHTDKDVEISKPHLLPEDRAEVTPKGRASTPKPRLLPVTFTPIKREPKLSSTVTPTLDSETDAPTQKARTTTIAQKSRTTTPTPDSQTTTATLKGQTTTPTPEGRTTTTTQKARTTTAAQKARKTTIAHKARKTTATQKAPTTTTTQKGRKSTTTLQGETSTPTPGSQTASTTQKAPTTTTTQKPRTTTPSPDGRTAMPNLDDRRFDPTVNDTSKFSSLPSSPTDFMGKSRFVAPHVVYKTDKGPEVPCSITESLNYFPEEEGGDLNVTSPPRAPPSNVTVVTVEGCPSFIILDWKKGDNETTEYEVTARAIGPNGDKVSVVNTNQTHTAVENLKPNSSYEFKVKPLNELGEGPSSDPVPFSTESADPRVSEHVSGKAAIWTQFPFNADEYSECHGRQFVKRTWYRKFVGIQLCNSLRYKIYLSDSLKGKFYNIGDQTGRGEDHCQFVDSFLDGRTGSYHPTDQLPPKTGYYRAMRQEPVSFGDIGGNTHITYVPWYECGTPIPGKW
ncbi:target of Nesh-SH3-like isoform X2 [Conger conger]|uniref:target of Nesh-SH3-like isoform X2 n=1 Tax=Conger conger TaxID=82655 RepID=UPI002A59C5A9|nr:target of Nesh-SH3-like isoform X2 [Conger conger]